MENIGEKNDLDAEKIENIISEQAKIIRALNKERNKIARLQLTSIAVLFTGLTLASENGILSIGKPIENFPEFPDTFILIPLLGIFFIGCLDILLLARGGVVSWFVPSIDPISVFAELQLRPTESNVESNNNLIENIEFAIGFQHIMTLFAILFFFSWITLHFFIYKTNFIQLLLGG